jgi:hypothetical protein
MYFESYFLEHDSLLQKLHIIIFKIKYLLLNPVPNVPNKAGISLS